MVSDCMYRREVEINQTSRNVIFIRVLQFASFLVTVMPSLTAFRSDVSGSSATGRAVSLFDGDPGDTCGVIRVRYCYESGLFARRILVDCESDRVTFCHVMTAPISWMLTLMFTEVPCGA